MKRIIRIYGQSVDEMPYKDIKSDLLSNGLVITKAKASSFAGCFFIEVEGNYTGNLPIDETDIDVNSFNWEV